MPTGRSIDAKRHPVSDDLRAALDAIASARGWPTAAEPARLGALVARLSSAYNEAGSHKAAAEPRELLPARLGFSFPRDVPKAAGAVRELVAAGLLAMPEGRPLRVLDLGAGMGATTFGVAHALAAAGQRGVLSATWKDEDEAALAIGAEIARRAPPGPIALDVHTSVADAHRSQPLEHDLVLLGQVLSELDPELPEDERVATHADLVAGLLARSVAPDGSLVIVEPALRSRSRHLHAVRDILATRGHAPFAPCLHAGPCPALAGETDWCHEDRPIDLPEWLAPVARAAGLRWQRLTFAYLVLRKDGATLARALPPRPLRLRLVSERMATKGKEEALVCGEAGGAPRAERLRVLDRDRERGAPGLAAWGELARGDVVAIDPPPEGTSFADGARLRAEHTVERLTLEEADPGPRAAAGDPKPGI